MPVLVTEAGFGPDDWTAGFLTLDALEAGGPPDGGLAVDLPNDRDPAALAPWLNRIALVRVAFPASSDGRGFSIARQLRAMGYAGRLRAAGPLIADQFRMARQVGYDEVELSDAVAARQPEAQWRLRPQGSYQARLTS
jgi:uncharacterized protein (DUF934 family)